MNQEQFARSFGTSRRNIGRWERNENLPQYGTVERLARYMGLEPEDFYPAGEESQQGDVAVILEQFVERTEHVNRLEVEKIAHLELELHQVRDLLAALVGGRAAAASLAETMEQEIDALAQELETAERGSEEARGDNGFRAGASPPNGK
jgi:transcriptional regulator with XRE-family HTH domain